MPYRQTEQFRRVKALIGDVLSRLRAPVAPSEVMDALNWVDDFIARCNRDDRGSCEFVNVLRRALASAPVADERTGSDIDWQLLRDTATLVRDRFSRIGYRLREQRRQQAQSGEPMKPTAR